jgi:hypothetical protein
VSFKTIRDTLTTVWPQVRESLDRVRESRDAVRANPGAASVSAQTRARRSWNKVVAEETIWAIAKADLLTTPQEREVLEAAKDWYYAWGGIGPRHDDEDYELYGVVEKLLTTSE